MNESVSEPIKNKYDFVVLMSVRKANPNGDPLNGNRPRIDNEDFGEISDVCIKRKIRNRLQDLGEKIFVQSDERNSDGYNSLRDRYKETIEKPLQNANKENKDKKDLNKDIYAKAACKEWIDVRSFGQVFAFKDIKKNDGNKDPGVSIGVRGPVSIHPAFSVDPIYIEDIQITKSVNSEPDEKKGPDTMGMKHRVNYGLYVLKGSINCQLAEKTGFSDSDAKKIHDALKTLFENDSSAARPEGSMVVERVYWWKHNSKSGQYPSIKVHNSVEIKRKEGITAPSSINDYDIILKKLDDSNPDDLKPDIWEL